MKRLSIIGLVVVLAIPIFAINLASAEDRPPVSQLSERIMQVAADDSLNISKRVQDRKANLKTQPTPVMRNTIITKCALAQGKLNTAKTRIATAVTNRSKAYSEVVNTVSDIATKLKASGYETRPIDSSLVALKTKVDTFNTDVSAYSQAISDLTTIECTKDPVGFSATLEAARDSHKLLVQDSQDIRTTVDGIKPLLKLVEQQLSIDTKQTKGN